MEKSAEDLEFSGNTKTIKFALIEKPALQFVTIYVQVLLKSQIKTYQTLYILIKMPSDTKLSSRLTRFFRRFFLDWAKSADISTFGMYA